MKEKEKGKKAMSLLHFKKSERAGFRPSVPTLYRKICRGGQALKALPRTLARVLQQPNIQYRIALLLAAFLVALILLPTLLYATTTAFTGRF